jgi:hypothetical protein
LVGHHVTSWPRGGDGSHRRRPKAKAEAPWKRSRIIIQLQKLYPAAFLYFKDDHLPADPDCGSHVFALFRSKDSRFVTLLTPEQFCGADLVQTMAASGSLGMAFGVESID